MKSSVAPLGANVLPRWGKKPRHSSCYKHCVPPERAPQIQARNSKRFTDRVRAVRGCVARFFPSETAAIARPLVLSVNARQPAVGFP